MGRSGGREKRLKTGAVSRSGARSRATVKISPSFDMNDSEEIERIYTILLEEADLSPGSHFEYAEMTEYDDPLFQAEGVFHQKHGIEVMLEEVHDGDDLPESAQKALSLMKKDLEYIGIKTGDLSLRDVFVLKRFIDNWNLDPKTEAARKLKESRDPKELAERVVKGEDTREIEYLNSAFEAAEASRLSDSASRMAQIVLSIEDEARAGATLLGREPDVDIVVLPSSNWMPSRSPSAATAGGAITDVSFPAQNQRLESGALSLVASDDLQISLLENVYDREEPYDETGRVADFDISDKALRGHLLKIVQHEFIHASQGGLTQSEMAALDPKEAGFIFSFTESITEGYNLKVFGESLVHESSDGAYLKNRRALKKIFQIIGVSEDQEKDLLEKLNHENIQDAISFLDQEMIKKGGPSIRELWEREVGKAIAPDNLGEY